MPCWLFIGWIDQMLAILDKPEGKAVHAIIENIASTYPDVNIKLFCFLVIFMCNMFEILEYQERVSLFNL